MSDDAWIIVPMDLARLYAKICVHEPEKLQSVSTAFITIPVILRYHFGRRDSQIGGISGFGQLLTLQQCDQIGQNFATLAKYYILAIF